MDANLIVAGQTAHPNVALLVHPLLAFFNRGNGGFCPPSAQGREGWPSNLPGVSLHAAVSRSYNLILPLHLKLPAVQNAYGMMCGHIKLNRHHRYIIILKRPGVGIFALIV